MGYKDHMYALSSKSGSEPFSFALFWGDLRWNDPDVTFTQERNNSKLYKNNNKLLDSAERYMEPEIIIVRMVGECSSSVTDSNKKVDLV